MVRGEPASAALLPMAILAASRRRDAGRGPAVPVGDDLGTAARHPGGSVAVGRKGAGDDDRDDEMADLYDACLAEVDSPRGRPDPGPAGDPGPGHARAGRCTRCWPISRAAPPTRSPAGWTGRPARSGPPGTWPSARAPPRRRWPPSCAPPRPRSPRPREDNPRPAIVWNISVHLADLREALGLPVLEAALWEPVLAAVAPYRLGDVPATVVAGDDAGAPGETRWRCRATSSTGRCSRAVRGAGAGVGEPGARGHQLDELPCSAHATTTSRSRVRRAAPLR